MENGTNICLKLLRCGLPILLTVLWLGFIFWNSMQNGEKSGEQSKEVHKVVNEVAQSVGVDEPISEANIRTGAHFAEFAILALLECWTLAAFGLIRQGQPLWRSVLCALAVIPDCALMACVDETIQRFSGDRAAEWKDVGMDTLGATLAVVFVMAVFLGVRLILQIKARKKDTT